jgi:hypothetical protein
MVYARERRWTVMSLPAAKSHRVQWNFVPCARLPATASGPDPVGHFQSRRIRNAGSGRAHLPVAWSPPCTAAVRCVELRRCRTLTALRFCIVAVVALAVLLGSHFHPAIARAWSPRGVKRGHPARRIGRNNYGEFRTLRPKLAAEMQQLWQRRAYRADLHQGQAQCQK